MFPDVKPLPDAKFSGAVNPSSPTRREPDDDTTRASPTGTRQDLRSPMSVEPRRPRSPEHQGPQRRRPEYDYFPDVDYLDYSVSG